MSAPLPFFLPPSYLTDIADSWHAGTPPTVELYFPVKPYPKCSTSTAARDDRTKWTVLPPNDRAYTIAEYPAHYPCPFIALWIPEKATAIDFDPFKVADKRLLLTYGDGHARVRPAVGQIAGPKTIEPFTMQYGYHRFDLLVQEGAVIERLSNTAVRDRDKWLTLWRMAPTDDPWVWVMEATVASGKGKPVDVSS